jgi:diguanylate cyclase (GGDEF)-like protein
LKILVVEDSRSNRALITAILNRLGHYSVEAEDGARAVALFEQEPPDLVLMDVQLPGMDGYEVTRRLRAMGGFGWIPIIFLSSMQSAGDIAAGIEAGGDDYLTKPIDPLILAAKVRAMQRIAEMRSELLRVSDQLEERNAELARLAHADGLTGIANRRLFDRELGRAWDEGVAARTPVSLLLADVDQFKQFNDRLGHLAGDDCLRQVAVILEESVPRQPCLAARYGGEEFVVLLPGFEAERAAEQGERIRAAIEAAGIVHPSSSCAPVVTLSIGVATVCAPVAGQSAQMVELADAALYRAKMAGRNRLARG